MSRRSLECVVIGGGAAGFFGAIACAEANPHAYVTLLEAGREPLTKVRISGGGRCNVTHACFDAATLVQHYPRGGKALRGAFTRFQPNDTIRWFAEHGVRLHTEADGRMFPTTNDSATIVDCLTEAARQAGVEIKTSRPVVAVRAVDEGFAIELKTGATLTCDRLLLATGSSPQGHRLAQGLGHQIEPPVPSLFTFNIADPHLHALAGVSVESAHLRLQLSEGKPLEQTGAVLITHWGLSGPAVLKLSAWGARSLHDHRYRGTLWVNWLPSSSADQIRQVLSETKTQHGKKAIATFNPLPLPRRLWHYLGDRSAIAQETRWADLSK
ncbi:MAG TPA: aminoacetone oxidase family FAD-binding enzyme, partial [Chroococcidiopsis sp.]